MLRIREHVMREMITHALQESPNEACGYLSEENGTVVAAHRMKNTDESGQHFSLDPEEQFAVVRTIRDEGRRPVAVYHSHPETPARPSREDIRLAFDPDIGYVIVSLAGGLSEIKAFRIRKGRVEEIPIEIAGT